MTFLYVQPRRCLYKLLTSISNSSAIHAERPVDVQTHQPGHSTILYRNTTTLPRPDGRLKRPPTQIFPFSSPAPAVRTVITSYTTTIMSIFHRFDLPYSYVTNSTVGTYVHTYQDLGRGPSSTIPYKTLRPSRYSTVRIGPLLAESCHREKDDATVGKHIFLRSKLLYSTCCTWRA